MIFFDNSHTTGIDLQLKNNFKALITIRQNTRYRDFVQGLYRMRKIIPEEDEEVYEPEHLPVKDYKTEPVKPKRQISDAQREHLNKIRELAMKKKAELKEITLKSKLAKTIPKQDLAKQ